MFCDDVDRPLMTWPDATDSNRPVSVVRWCRSRPSVFFVLDSESHLYIWDLNMDESSALKRELITQQSRSLHSPCSLFHFDYTVLLDGIVFHGVNSIMSCVIIFPQLTIPIHTLMSSYYRRTRACHSRVVLKLLFHSVPGLVVALLSFKLDCGFIYFYFSIVKH